MEGIALGNATSQSKYNEIDDALINLENNLQEFQEFILELTEGVNSAPPMVKPETRPVPSFAGVYTNIATRVFESSHRLSAMTQQLRELLL